MWSCFERCCSRRRKEKKEEQEKERVVEKPIFFLVLPPETTKPIEIPTIPIELFVTSPSVTPPVVTPPSATPPMTSPIVTTPPPLVVKPTTRLFHRMSLRHRQKRRQCLTYHPFYKLKSPYIRANQIGGVTGPC